MRFHALLTIVAGIVLLGTSIHSTLADELDPASAEALIKTQEMLRNPQERAKAVSDNPQAQRVDRQAQSLGGSPENTNAIYDLSSDILESLVQQTGGDANKMKALLEEAKNNPKAFAEKLTPEQRQKLHDISTRTPASATSNLSQER